MTISQLLLPYSEGSLSCEHISRVKPPKTSLKIQDIVSKRGKYVWANFDDNCKVRSRLHQVSGVPPLLKSRQKFFGTAFGLTTKVPIPSFSYTPEKAYNTRS